jgi:methylmalonyl-CoA epimerase
MEIADIFVVNKADREGADRTAASIEAMLSLETWTSGRWRPPVLRTEATTGKGVRELLDGVNAFRAQSGAAADERRRSRADWRLREILSRQFLTHLETAVLAPGEMGDLLERIATREIDPYTAARDISSRALGAATHWPTLDHVGVAVSDAALLRGVFERLFGVATSEAEDLGEHRVRFIELGDATIELVEALTADAPVAKFLEKKGRGLHHVCLRVKDIDATLDDLKKKGVKLIDQAPRRGAHGSRIAFLHPGSTEGILVEIKELAT